MSDNFLCVNGLCSPICLARREGDNPEELCVTGSAEVQMCCSSRASPYCRHMVQQGAGDGSTGLVCDSCGQCCQLPSLVSMPDGYPQLTLVKPTVADRSWGQAEVHRISVTLWTVC